MKFKIEELEEFEEYSRSWQLPVEWIREVVASSDSGEEELYHPDRELTLEVSFRREGEDVHFMAHLRGEIPSTCVRCLEGGLQQIETEFYGLFRKPDEDDLPEPDDIESFFYREEEINFLDPAREYLLLTLPDHPVCDESCKGLCPMCGQNLNRGECSCHVEEVDPRWSALLELSEVKKILKK